MNRWQKSKNLQKNQAIQGDLFAIFTDEEADDAKESGISTLENTDHEYHLLDNEDEIRDFCAQLLTFEKVALDTETTDKEAFKAKLVGMSFLRLRGAHGTFRFHVKQMQPKRAWNSFAHFGKRRTF